MNSDIIKGKWKEIKGSAKARWAELTDDDLAEVEGDAEALAGKLQQKYGWEKDRVQKELDAFAKEHTDR